MVEKIPFVKVIDFAVGVPHVPREVQRHVPAEAAS
jgi:hypothetical protein